MTDYLQSVVDEYRRDLKAKTEAMLFHGDSIGRLSPREERIRDNAIATALADLRAEVQALRPRKVNSVHQRGWDSALVAVIELIDDDE